MQVTHSVERCGLGDLRFASPKSPCALDLHVPAQALLAATHAMTLFEDEAQCKASKTAKRWWCEHATDHGRRLCVCACTLPRLDDTESALGGLLLAACCETRGSLLTDLTSRARSFAWSARLTRAAACTLASPAHHRACCAVLCVWSLDVLGGATEFNLLTCPHRLSSRSSSPQNAIREHPGTQHAWQHAPRAIVNVAGEPVPPEQPWSHHSSRTDSKQAANPNTGSRGWRSVRARRSGAGVPNP